METREISTSSGRLSGRLLLAVCIAALGGFLFGFDSAIINGGVDAIQLAFDLSPGMLGVAVSCALLGAALGAWYAGVFAERVGRVRTMLIAAGLLAVAAIGSAFAFSVWDLILWRFVGGVGVGFASVIAPAYIAEVAPAHLRGRLGTLQQLSLVTGIFLALLVGAALARVAGGAAEPWLGLAAWRWMLLSALLPSIVYGALALSLPESPRYLVEKNRPDEARRVLTGFVGIASGPAVEQKIEEIQQTVDTEHRQRFSDLLGGRFGLKTIVWAGILLSVLQQFVGINVIFYYSTTLWKSVGFQESDSFTISVITSLTNLVSTVIAIALVDILGRKLLLMIGSVVMTVSLGTMAIAFSQATTVDGALSLPDPWGVIALIAANLFVVGFAASWGPLVWLLLGEMFPNRIRAMALGIGGAAQWVANFVVTATFPVLSAASLALAYGLYAGFALISFFVVRLMIRETKGRELEDMVA
ncbi:sugar porter family MFS transporter [Kocuria palustris]|jgi:SP family sugar:H+ symporter-like MFS transporter|uniref:sugar porter family MFS transporter n=1 Tax=Kocuria TaxID=57493 RepID=UPI0019CFF132|nr:MULTISPECIES: sugar porter family MFS transporter [Kocuria]MBN6753864.1 sugar porter family MFS transporter [Kocuria palustris]MBN6759156.1 sugar porter family MFS transporter [Kocuria palustris]MBN6763937.1 sugar porter family MFS transporter [Kocuria palustris]MBN6783706.1 sugar porter family MFS transporter [Kocuria palustris]MBN6799798.1 sugar porter family MFS transporter [Kocuria palustris]